MWKAILLVLLGLRPNAGDHESEAERSERMTIVAKSIDYAASRGTCSGAYSEDESCKRIYHGDRVELASMLTALGYMESGFALNVHEGRCRQNECDSYVLKDRQGRVYRVVHRARSPWQVHFNPMIRDVWDDMQGTTQWQTANAAWAATMVLSASKSRCKDRLGAISGYAGSATCRWSGAPRRLELVERVEAKLMASESAPAGAVAFSW